MFNRLYLNIPYAEKEEAKKFGARWNPEKKQWFFNGNPKDYVKFGKWLFDIKTCERVYIICDVLYILEGKRECWKCKKETPVVGLGVEKFVEVYDTERNDEKGNPIYGIEMIGFNNEKELFVTWFYEEKEYPNFLLKYLKENYDVKTGFSRIAGKNFANHCKYCEALQGNNFIFEEFYTPFSLTEESLKKNIEKIKNLRIKKIQLKENFIASFSYGFSGNEYLYLKYGNIENLILE